MTVTEKASISLMHSKPLICARPKKEFAGRTPFQDLTRAAQHHDDAAIEYFFEDAGIQLNRMWPGLIVLQSNAYRPVRMEAASMPESVHAASTIPNRM